MLVVVYYRDGGEFMKPAQQNQSLRDYARANGVPLWMIAESYGVHVMTLIGRLRKPFNKEQSDAFMRIVDEKSVKDNG